MHFVAHDLQRPKQIAGASQTQEKHRGAAVSRHAFSINPPAPFRGHSAVEEKVFRVLSA